MKMKSSNLLWGLFFILIGLGYAGNAFDFWEFTLFFSGWWTLFLIIPSVISIVERGFSTSNVCGLGIGTLLLLSNQGWIEGVTLSKLMIPCIFVFIGVCLIFRNDGHSFKKKVNFNYNGNTEHSSVFSGHRFDMSGEKFTGSAINAIFGGVELDLRNAIIEEDIVIHATAVFGGIDIRVPSNVRVKENTVNIFGGTGNKAMKPIDPNAPTVYINGTCMFGGIDIK